MANKKILEPIEQELKKLRTRITFLEGKVFYNSIKKKVEKELLKDLLASWNESHIKYSIKKRLETLK